MNLDKELLDISYTDDFFDFSKAHNRRPADKCCAVCKFGEWDYDGMNQCHFPGPDLIDGREYRSTYQSDTCDEFQPQDNQ